MRELHLFTFQTRRVASHRIPLLADASAPPADEGAALVDEADPFGNHLGRPRDLTHQYGIFPGDISSALGLFAKALMKE